MTPTEFIQWLKDQDLFSTVQKYSPYCKPILEQCLAVRKEFLLIIGDWGYPDNRCAPLLTGCYLLAAKRLGLRYKLAMQEPKRVHSSADDRLIQSLMNFPDHNVLAIAISGKLGSMKVLGKSFRKYVKSRNHRFASTMSLQELPTKNFPDLAKTFNVDYKELQEKGMELKQRLDAGKTVRVTTPAGTNLTVDIDKKYAIANTGYYTTKRTGGNFPAGEVYIPPRGKGVDGKAVIDISSKIRGSTVMLRQPIKLTIENGGVVELSGGEEVKLLEETLSWAENKAKYSWGVRRIGELGIGINPKASTVGPNLINEKTLGTAHIAIGSNAWFGGTIFAITHLDQVFRNPTVYIDNERIKI